MRIKSEFGASSSELRSRAAAIAKVADHAHQEGNVEQVLDLIEIIYEIEDLIPLMKMTEIFSLEIFVDESEAQKNFFQELLGIRPENIMRAAGITGVCQLWWDAIVALGDGAKPNDVQK